MEITVANSYVVFDLDWELYKEIFGYRTQCCRKTLCLAGSIFSFGILPLVFYWKPAWHVWANCIPCSLQEADVVLLRTTVKPKSSVYIPSLKSTQVILNLILLEFKDWTGLIHSLGEEEDEFQTYSRKKVMWICLSALNSAFRLSPDNPFITDEESIINRAVRKPDLKVIKQWNAEAEFYLYSEMHKSAENKICLGQLGRTFPENWVLNPFYVFQLFSVCLWFSEDYKEYAFAIIIMSIISIALTVYDLREQSVKLHRLVEAHNNITVSICGKNAGVQELESRFLVPGDLLILMGSKVHMPCDAILIDGSCVVNEGMLTGESIPVTKTPLPKMDGSVPWKTQSEGEYKRHVLFCGTEVIQAKGACSSTVKAVVLQTVPPALPAALTTGIMYAQRRLKKRGIFCISPQRINVCGQLNLVCFDKTGTLTRDGLDLWGVVPCDGNGIIIIAITVYQKLTMYITVPALLYPEDRPSKLDREERAGATVNREKKDNKAPVEGLAILHQFPFSSALQRMTVVVQEMGGDQLVFMKVPTSFVSELQIYTTQGFRVIGLAYKKLEMDHHISALMSHSYTSRDQVEADLIFLGLLILENRLKEETKPVLEELISARIRTVMITGDNLQTAVTVARKSGMVSESQKVILIEANETTGSSSASISWKLLEEKKHIAYKNQDNYINIREEISDNSKEGSYHFALNGKSFQVISQHFSSLLPKVLMNGTIFARMSPGQKSSLVEEFQKLDYFVGMCGDGANDCGALKMAHVGVSLSEQEASVASPFTSKTPNIECVPHLIKEGRAALVTSFCMFKYMALYSMIQYVGVLLLYWNVHVVVPDQAPIFLITSRTERRDESNRETNNLSNYQFLFQDLAITTIIGVTMNLNGAYPKLVPFRPAGRLISPPLLLSVILNILLSLAMHTVGFILVQRQPWYSMGLHSACTVQNDTISKLTISPTAPVKNGTNGVFTSFENTTIWFLGTINCIVVALVFSKGKPFRQPTYKNYIFVLVLVVQLSVCLFILFADIPELYRFLDEAIIENRALWMIIKRCFGYQSKSQYRIWQRALANDPSWPPVNQTSYSDMPECGRGVSYSNPVFESNEDQL
ncbi:hypothetical protein MJG53_000963 [Ovis ammon polii x Ovis aries]|uniref:Uncharacterized protein n=1 Tax=Ovis ammon polii x Ovis aries TaxID=2918886 RepID=A0ACB9VK47_9CETA|nr:hypothetical protein MJT46_000456 [Ovis ammon polii x Ovis aries]KAI4589914.1 hypothetical protein MJG53_000963 [Ovis ammon polii x Ovis aries]